MESSRKVQFQEGIRYLKEKNRLTQKQLADAAGCSPRHIMSILSKKENKGAGPNIEQKLAEYFNVSYQHILDLGRAVLDGDGQNPGEMEHTEKRRLIKIPLISWNLLKDPDRVMGGIQLGDTEDWVGLYRDDSGLSFALQIKGDAMSPEFNPGEIIIVDPELIPETGEFAIIRVMGDEGGETLFKQFMTDGNRVYLKSINENYPFMEITRREYRMIGCVIQKIKKYHP